MKLAPDITLPPATVTDVFAIMGKRGSGKTITGQLLFELFHGIGAQCVVMDPIGAWWSLRVMADGKSPGLPITVFGGAHGDVPFTGDKEHAKLIARVVVERQLSCVIDVSRLDDTPQKQFATAFVAELFRLKQDLPSPLHLFLEEASTFLPQEKEDGHDVPMLVAMKKIARKGRNYGFGLSMLDQRPQDVNKKALNQAEILIALQVVGTQELAALRAWFHDKEVPRDIEMLKRFQPGEALVVSPGLLQVNLHTRINMKATYNASATPKVGQASVVAPRPLDAAELDRLRGDLQAVVARAEEVDPARLRQRIAVLEHQCRHAAVEAAAAQPQVDLAPIRAAADSVLALAGEVRDFARVCVRIDAIADAADRIATQLRGVGNGHTSRPVFPTPGQPPTRTPAPISPARSTGLPGASPGAFNPSSPQPNPPLPPLKAGARRMLDALASLRATQDTPVTRARLALVCGMKASGGTFQSYLSSLRTAWYIDGTSDSLWLTGAGIAAAGPERAVRGRDEVFALWMPKLKGGARRMLEVVADSTSISRGNLAARLDMEVSGGTFQSYLSSLKTAGLVTTNGNVVALNEEIL